MKKVVFPVQINKSSAYLSKRWLTSDGHTWHSEDVARGHEEMVQKYRPKDEES